MNEYTVKSSDKGLIYTGEDIPHLDIKKGDDYSVVTAKIVNNMTIESPKEDSYTGKLYNLGAQNSDCALKIKVTEFNYSAINNGSFDFTYDLTGVISNLPFEFQVSSIEVNAIGSNSYGESMVTKLDMAMGGFMIPLSKVPVSIIFKILLSTECGMIELSQKITIFEQITGISYLNINDNSKNESYSKTKDQVIELLAAEVSRIKQEITNLKKQVGTIL